MPYDALTFSTDSRSSRLRPAHNSHKALVWTFYFTKAPQRGSGVSAGRDSLQSGKATHQCLVLHHLQSDTAESLGCRRVGCQDVVIVVVMLRSRVCWPSSLPPSPAYRGCVPTIGESGIVQGWPLRKLRKLCRIVKPAVQLLINFVCKPPQRKLQLSLSLRDGGGQRLSLQYGATAKSSDKQQVKSLRNQGLVMSCAADIST